MSEIDSLRSRLNSLPADLDRVRRALCDSRTLNEDDIAFAGELLDVRPADAESRGAAEGVLRGLALTMLVPQQRYTDVSHWVNDSRVDARLVFRRVAERRVRTVPTAHSGRRLVDVIEVEPGGFADYLAAELARRAHHVLAASVDELSREDRAVTLEGRVREGDHHEKDDRRRAADPRSWMLGRASEQKIAALEEERDG